MEIMTSKIYGEKPVTVVTLWLRIFRVNTDFYFFIKD